MATQRINSGFRSAFREKCILNKIPNSVTTPENLQISSNTGLLSKNLALSYFHQISFKGNVNNQITINPKDIDSTVDCFIDELIKQDHIDKETVKKTKKRAFENNNLPDLSLKIEDMKDFPFPEKIPPNIIALCWHDMEDDTYYNYLNFNYSNKTEFVCDSTHEFSHFLLNNTKNLKDNKQAVIKNDLWEILDKSWFYLERSWFSPKKKKKFDFFVEKELNKNNITSPEQRLISIITVR